MQERKPLDRIGSRQKFAGICAGFALNIGVNIAGQTTGISGFSWVSLALTALLCGALLRLRSQDQREAVSEIQHWQEKFRASVDSNEEAQQTLRKQETLVRVLTEQIPDLIARFDLSGHLLFANQAFRAAVGKPHGLLSTQPFKEWELSEPTVICWNEALAQVEESAQTLQCDFALSLDATQRWYDGCFIPEWDEAGRVVSVLLSARDITKRKRIEQQTSENKRMVQRVADASPNILYIYDLVLQQCTYANRELTSILGYTLDDLQEFGMALLSHLTHPDDLEWLMAHHDAMLEANDDNHLELEYRMCHKEGGWRWLLSRDVVFSRTPEGLPCQILGAAQDITERKRIEEQIDIQMLALNEYSLQLEMQTVQLEQANVQLEALAITDGLTGLKNIRAFQERLSEEFTRAKRYGEEFAVILLDVDRFKQYNDSFGHPAGDEVLKQVAIIMQETARETDYVARYGGEEFIVSLPHTDAQGAVEVAERLRTQIEAAEWAFRPVTVSIGVAHITPRVETPAMLIADADKALYSSKSGGRNLTTLHEVEHRWTARQTAA